MEKRLELNLEALKNCPVCGEKAEEWFAKDSVGLCMKVPRMCRCRREAYEREQAEREQKQRMQKINRYREQGLADAQYRSCTFDRDDGQDRHASAFCREYVKNWEQMQAQNAGILLWGDVGGGKTFYAAAIVNALIDQGVPAVMTTLPQLTARMQKDFGAERKQVLSMVKSAPLLVLDDVGTERHTEYGNELVYEVINERYKAQKPLIVTTNLSMEAVKSPEDMSRRRIYDRILEMCPPCKVTGLNRRQEACRKKLAYMEQQMRETVSASGGGGGGVRRRMLV